MGRKKKLINNTDIPQYAIERFARCVFDDIRAAYADEEIQKEFAAWQAEQAAKKAELSFRVLKESNDGTYIVVEIHLKTGRHHQIRVQMAHMGCPLWGDQRYGFKVNKKGQQLALYAVKLRLTHPTKKESMQFICYPPQIAPWPLFRLNIE